MIEPNRIEFSTCRLSILSEFGLIQGLFQNLVAHTGNVTSAFIVPLSSEKWWQFWWSPMTWVVSIALDP